MEKIEKILIKATATKIIAQKKRVLGLLVIY